MENTFDWFVLGNYRRAATFTARHWHKELRARVNSFELLLDPEATFSSPEEKHEYQNMALRFFSDVKKFGLVSNFSRKELFEAQTPVDQYFEALDTYGLIRSKFRSIKPLSVWEVFALVKETENHEEIMQETELFHKLDIFDEKERQRRAKIYAKYSRPFSDLAGWTELSERFISVNLEASEEQTLKEFRLWLTEEREKFDHAVSASTPAKMFSESDYQDWYLAKILPYFDLRAIAKIEGVRAPNHLIANLLFPEEIGVDVSERVRKVTKVKAERVFRHEVVSALYLQAEMESEAGTK